MPLELIRDEFIIIKKDDYDRDLKQHSKKSVDYICATCGIKFLLYNYNSNSSTLKLIEEIIKLYGIYKKINYFRIIEVNHHILFTRN
ncbi:hypothetical protein XA3_01960 [Xylocopilactobacillus apicola]|uniref:Uncharacterized protein n=1 Tax=Xylocopilactobacillus apicola TaxID=2932184 RepID=A0AAU9D657_9LACO|nr:hypothetical protein XA3_01960 [Xylocopilactobacillus apicola]